MLEAWSSPAGLWSLEGDGNKVDIVQIIVKMVNLQGKLGQTR
jgi:hypothetical protein